jgi:hypothetical protein
MVVSLAWLGCAGGDEGGADADAPPVGAFDDSDARITVLGGDAAAETAVLDPDAAAVDAGSGLADAVPPDSDAAAMREPDAAAMREPDAAAMREPDAAAMREPDAARSAEPDAALPLEPDAALPLEPDAALPLEPDAALPPVHDAALPPEPDAAPPGPDAALPDPDAARPPGPDLGDYTYETPPIFEDPEGVADLRIVTAGITYGPDRRANLGGYITNDGDARLCFVRIDAECDRDDGAVMDNIGFVLGEVRKIVVSGTITDTCIPAGGTAPFILPRLPNGDHDVTGCTLRLSGSDFGTRAPDARLVQDGPLGIDDGTVSGRVRNDGAIPAISDIGSIRVLFRDADAVYDIAYDSAVPFGVVIGVGEGVDFEASTLHADPSPDRLGLHLGWDEGVP